MKMSYYTIRQNNSGGYFEKNENVTHYVIVEANSPGDAELKIEEIVEDYSEYCECCGERWYIDFDESDGKDLPMIYNDSVYETTESWFTSEAIIYRLDGTKELVKFKKD